MENPNYDSKDTLSNLSTDVTEFVTSASVTALLKLEN